MTAAEALAKLKRTVDLDAFPPVSDQEAGDILAESARWSERTGETEYAFGAFVRSASGRLLRAVAAGTTAAAEPSGFAATCRGYLVTDGTVRWEDVGPAHNDPYDFTAAKRRLYDLRAQRTAELIATSDAGQSVHLEQQHEHWVRMRDAQRPFYAV